MSVEPITITTKHNTQIFNLDNHQNLAAQQMGLEPDDIHCTGTGPDEIEEVQAEIWSEPVFSQDGPLLKPAELIQPRVLRYVRRTTWSEKPRAAATQVPETAPAEPEIAWPEFPTMHRGQRWHGLVTVDGITAERAFIHDGEKLVLVSSPEGLAVMKALDAEREAEAVPAELPTGG